MCACIPIVPYNNCKEKNTFFMCLFVFVSLIRLYCWCRYTGMKFDALLVELHA